jgi:hypothetical protein
MQTGLQAQDPDHTGQQPGTNAHLTLKKWRDKSKSFREDPEEHCRSLSGLCQAMSANPEDTKTKATLRQESLR